jgi:hypothetical protein
MNKQEEIKKIEQMGEYEHFVDEPISKASVFNILNQLDEPEKVTIPQFVADWIEESKKSCENVVEFFEYRSSSFEITKWLEEEKRFDLVARAWLDGYEVEKEKRYLVKMKNILDRESFLNLSNTTKIWFFGDKKDTEYVYVHHTRKELEEAGFGWVFDCPGVQIEEVEE